MKSNDVLELLSILNRHTARELSAIKSPDEYWSYGAAQLEERIMHVADWSASRWPGDLMQIACQVGRQTRALAAVARKHRRRLIVLLLWGKGAANWNCRSKTHRQDMRLVKPFRDIIDLVIGRPRFKQVPICFALVDSVKDDRAYRHDIGLVSHCSGIIAVSDARAKNVAVATMIRSRDLRRGFLLHPLCHEGYLLPRLTCG